MTLKDLMLQVVMSVDIHKRVTIGDLDNLSIYITSHFALSPS